MEFLKNVTKGFLEGVAIGGSSVAVTKLYNDIIKDIYPKWFVMAIDTLVLTGCTYTGIKATKALDNYLDENDL